MCKTRTRVLRRVVATAALVAAAGALAAPTALAATYSASPKAFVSADDEAPLALKVEVSATVDTLSSSPTTDPSPDPTSGNGGSGADDPGKGGHHRGGSVNPPKGGATEQISASDTMRSTGGLKASAYGWIRQEVIKLHRSS
ncbi:hypothetical protein [Streptomyces olivaceus]|uniref:hypothetical protein n=1 Tax=Streptomyces olivaceus TaxID=47716 RepID=UPI0040579BC6